MREASVAALERIMDRWADAVERRDAGACAALCADDAVVLSSDAPTAIGREASPYSDSEDR